jgi:hypothetical protein
MSLTIFLARLIGLYCALIALSMLLRRRETITTINSMIDNPGDIMLAGVIALAAGLAIIIGHDVWSGGTLSIAVTCLGWVVAAKGAMLLLLPAPWLKGFYESLSYERFFTLYMGATLVLGLLLLGASLA